jgi:hypothetical protein
MLDQSPCGQKRCTIEEIAEPVCKAFCAVDVMAHNGEHMCLTCWHLESCHRWKVVE